MKIGWIGVGRMGAPMAARLLKAGYAVSVWNRTRAKADAEELKGATVVDAMADLADVDVLFTMLSTGKDVHEVCFGANGMFREGVAKKPPLLIDCSTIGVDESAAIRTLLSAGRVEFLAAPVSGNPRCVRAGKFCCAVSGPREAYDNVRDILLAICPSGAAYVGEGELARICKMAVNLMLHVVTGNMMEVTLLAEKAGVPRHAFLEFLNGSVVGSTYTRYKTPAVVNLDWTTTFHSLGIRKDMDLGLSLARQHGITMPTTVAMRELLQGHFGAAQTQPDPDAYLHLDYANLLETVALLSGMQLESENVEVSDGLEPEHD